MKTEIEPIAYLESDFKTKFGIPRQAGLVEELKAKIIFTQEYRNSDALRGIEGFSHLWLIWQFSENVKNGWSPTVRPPRLGGNERVGVFATRSPFRPNFLGMSCVKLERVVKDGDNGTVLIVSGADMMDGTPVFDIKPYIPYSDSIPDAKEGFAAKPAEELTVSFQEGAENQVPEDKRSALKKVLACDPRPRYHDDPARVYGMEFAGMDIRFKVAGKELTVVEIKQI